MEICMNSVFSIRNFYTILKKYYAKNCFRSSAALSYFLILTLFPLLIGVQWILGTLGEDILSFFQHYAVFIPSDALSVLENYIAYSQGQSDNFILIGIGTAVYTGASAYRTFSGILRDIFECQPKSTIFHFGISFIWAALFLLFIYVSAIVFLCGKWLIGFLSPFFEKFLPVDLWLWFRFIALILVSVFVLYFLYLSAEWYGSAPIVIFPGAIVSSLLLAVSGMIFSRGISLSVNRSLIYGSLTSVILLLFWFNLLGNIVIIGALINQNLRERRSSL